MNLVKNVLKWRLAVRRQVRVKLTGKLYLNDLFEMKEFNAALVNGHIRRQVHPFENLAVVYYTETAAFDRVWNDATLNCRGLIYNYDTNEVVARPFSKFFNHNQPEAPSISLDEPVTVSDKMDGSLGILYRQSSGEWRIATKGSFTSDQAIHGSTILNTKYESWEPVEGFTYLFEIVYPDNRIVCNYGDIDDLILLGAIEINSGLIFGPDASDWPGPRAEVFSANTYAEALAMPPRKGKEGVVVRTLDDDRMVKIKQEDYCRIHALISNLSSYSIWNNLMEGKTVEEIVEVLPDEFHEWTSGVAQKIIEAKNNYIDQATFEFENIEWAETRKEFAMLASKSSYRSALFNLYDDKSIEEQAWKNVKPALITLGQSKDDLYAVSLVG